MQIMKYVSDFQPTSDYSDILQSKTVVSIIGNLVLYQKARFLLIRQISSVV
jgi:hypothetical protein